MSSAGDAGCTVNRLGEARSSRYHTAKCIYNEPVDLGLCFHLVAFVQSYVLACAVAPSGQSPAGSPKGLAMGHAGAGCCLRSCGLCRALAHGANGQHLRQSCCNSVKPFRERMHLSDFVKEKKRKQRGGLVRLLLEIAAAGRALCLLARTWALHALVVQLEQRGDANVTM